MPEIREIIHCLRAGNIEVQLNAAAYLQHLTYQNEESKEAVRLSNGIPALISMLSSRSSTCQLNAACVLRNLSHGKNVQIKTQIQQCGGIEIIESLLERSHQLQRGLTEALVAILCNMSCNIAFQVPIVNSALSQVVRCVLLPLLGTKMDSTSLSILPFKYSDLSFTYDSLLEYITAFLKNLSSGYQYIRQKLRYCEGLLYSVVTIVQHSHLNGYLESTIVENCLCIIRNLCYALQEVVDPDYLSKKSVADSGIPGNGKKGNSNDNNDFGSHSSKELMLSPRTGLHSSSNSRHSMKNGVDLLWDDIIIDILLLIINECYNYSTVEAAIGAVQNLSACDWHLSKEFRFNFRKKKGLPSLVIQLNNGPDRVVNVVLTAFRNLGEDNRNLDLIGKHCLYHMTRLLPSISNPVIKRTVVCGSENDAIELPEEYIGLDTIYKVLSLVFFILRSSEVFCQEFVEMNGVKSCIFLLTSEYFYKEHLRNCSANQSENADKIPVLAANILQMLWGIQELGHHFKKEKLNCEDFCVQTMASEIKSSLSCSQKNAPPPNSVYYGKPYVKARSNALLPWTYKLNQRQSIKDKDQRIRSGEVSPHRNSMMPTFMLNNEENEVSQSTPSQMYSGNGRYASNHIRPDSNKELFRPSMNTSNENQRRRKMTREL